MTKKAMFPVTQAVIDEAVVKAELEYMESNKGRAKFNELVEARDTAQRILSDWVNRKQFLTAQRVKHLEVKVRQPEPEPPPAPQQEDDQLVDTAGAAKILGVTKGTLIVWRSKRRYRLTYVKVGRKVMYSMRDLVAFVESRRVVPKIRREKVKQ